MPDNIISQRWHCPEGYLYFRQEVADPPSKDYFQLIVTSDKTVSFKVWNVTPPFKATARRGPIAFQSTFEHFSTDVTIRDAIQSRLRGELEFLDNLLEGKFNYLDQLDTQLQLYIVSFLDVCSTLRLSATSRHFHQLCEDNSIWKRHFLSSNLPYFVTPGLMDIVDKKGWKAFYIIVNRIAQSTDEIGTRFLLQKAPPTCLGHRSSSQIASSSSSPKVQSKTTI
ncbi:unnamed protein product [Candidula unifasciata]|uniref:F-box domain-containing protein n=1 Tax=Candidula unifasciata TaxID=100452 RepID=A0A8S3YBB9_9EUPU|nr:unnamed protein product [Candidula unifasciata]